MPFRPFDAEAEIEHSRRRLPHWFQNGRTYFVTFRLADSLPKTTRDQYTAERSAWLEVHGVASLNALSQASEETRKAFRTRFSERLESLLDGGHGSCILGQPACSSIVASALRHFDGQRYHLDCYVVMPNHVHCILSPLDQWTLSRILQSWKRHTAREINRLSGTTGTSIWLDENFDHIVRSEEQLDHFRRYIRDNPTLAGLEADAFRLGQGRIPDPPEA